MEINLFQGGIKKLDAAQLEELKEEQKESTEYTEEEIDGIKVKVTSNDKEGQKLHALWS